MSYNLITNVESCYAWISVTPFGLIYYSTIPTAIVALSVGLFVLYKDRKALLNKLLFSFSLTFFLWSFADLITWTYTFDSVPSSIAWALLNATNILLFTVGLYFTYVFLSKKDLPFYLKLILGALLLPAIIFAPTRLNVAEFDATGCSPMDGKYFSYYQYFINILIILWIIILSIIRYRQAAKEFKKQVLLFSFGISFFFIFFCVTGYLAPYLYGLGIVNDYRIESIGMFGMPIFMVFLGYLIVRYKAFDIKLIATQALVVALVALIGSQFFFIQNTTNIILNGVTLALVLGFGYVLVKSVKLEVQRKEELQVLSGQLSDANAKLRQLDKAKSEFISIASHQLRTPLTSIKGFGSLLLEGTYGVVPEAQRGALEKIYISNERLIQLVEDLLNISRIEAGRMEFDFQEARIEDLVQEAVQTLELSAKAKDLYLHWQKSDMLMPKLKIDITKIKEVISNMVDNAIKYTQKGGITVKLEANTTWDTEHKEHKSVVRVVVSDTGIGMDAEEVAMIFEKFQRGKQVSHYHTDGTGLGMYIGKKIVAEHKGKIWAESEGKGKGSRFILELPVG